MTGISITINLSIDPAIQAALQDRLPVGKKRIGPWDSSKPTPDSFSVNEDPYPKPSDGEVSPRGLKEKYKPGYYGYSKKV